MSDNEEYTDESVEDRMVTARWFGEGDDEYAKLVVSEEALTEYGSEKVDELFINAVEALDE